MYSERLFSYGTLQLDAVQLSTFGRLLDGAADVLPGFEQAMVLIEDADVVATSGQTHHPILSFSSDPAHCVAGRVFRISPEELAQADRYEVAAYRRVSVTLASGLKAWVYVDARFAPPSTSGDIP
ncbi:MAG: gamma-glutamylcyclotransferase family protein [Pseudomonadota bacterium]